MNKIDFPRLGADGKVYSQKDIENWYLDTDAGVTEKIKNNLEKEKKKCRKAKQKKLLEYLDKKLDDILIASPVKLADYLNDIEKDYGKILYYNRYSKTRHELKRHNTKFCKRLLVLFGYSEFRKDVLVELSKKLNVKTCPYCNQSFTLFVCDGDKQSYAEFQFDHFFDKSRYPYLSMSLYNLIPACGNCNHRKGVEPAPVYLNPYYGDTYSLFKFHVKDSSQLAAGAFKPDSIGIEIIQQTGEHAIGDFLKELHIVQQYERHRDIVQEIYDKVYSMIYYEYKGLWNSGVLPSIQEADRKYLLELWVGVPLDKTKIDTKPLTKFIQDIWEQATEEYHMKNIFW